MATYVAVGPNCVNLVRHAIERELGHLRHRASWCRRHVDDQGEHQAVLDQIHCKLLLRSLLCGRCER